VRVVGGDGFWRRPEVTDVVSALTLVTDPHNELAALTVLRSPLVGIPDDDILALFEALPTRGTTSWPAIVLASDDDLVSAAAKDRVRAFDALLHAARAHLATRPLVAILDDLIEGSAYDVACAAEPDAAQRLRHLEKLRAICGGKGDQGVLAIARLTDSVDDPPPEPVAFDAAIDEDAVRVMTIHQSKGLEADVVVLCDATVALRGNTDDVVFAPDVGLAVSPRRRPIARCAPAASASAGTCVQRARRALRARDEAELARLLYVAVTRARHAVYVVGEVKRAGSSSMLGLLAAARDADAGAFDALLPRVVVDAVSSRRYAAAKRPVPEASPPRAEQSAARTPVARLRASALLAAATPQLAIGLVGPGFEIHDDDVIPPRARGRLAHAIIGLIATADVDAILEDATAAAAIGAAERAIGAPPGAVDEGLRARVLTTLTGPLRALRLAGCTFESEVPTVLALDTAVVEGTADLVAHGKDGVTVIELKLSVAAARSEAALVQVLACCAGLEQRGAATRGGREVSVRAATWAIGERDPPASVLWGKVTKRHLASVLARVVST
jgi:ATP-dependent helicase/nuclease subunit A